MARSEKTTKAVPAAALAARREAAKRLAGELDAAKINAQIARTLAEDPDHPADEAQVEAADAAVVDAEAALAGAAEALGTTPEKITRADYKSNLREQVKSWKTQRLIHADMAENPDAYGGVDMGGAPIDVDEQRRLVIEYDVAITTTEQALNSQSN